VSCAAPVAHATDAVSPLLPCLTDALSRKILSVSNPAPSNEAGRQPEKCFANNQAQSAMSKNFPG
jgi:hypothetical protein